MKEKLKKRILVFSLFWTLYTIISTLLFYLLPDTIVLLEPYIPPNFFNLLFSFFIAFLLTFNYKKIREGNKNPIISSLALMLVIILFFNFALPYIYSPVEEDLRLEETSICFGLRYEYTEYKRNSIYYQDLCLGYIYQILPHFPSTPGQEKEGVCNTNRKQYCTTESHGCWDPSEAEYLNETCGEILEKKGKVYNCSNEKYFNRSIIQSNCSIAMSS